MRKTNNWKHNGKNKKQWLHNGMVRIDGFYQIPYTATEGYWKRQSPFMDLSDIDNDDN